MDTEGGDAAPGEVPDGAGMGEEGNDRLLKVPRPFIVQQQTVPVYSTHVVSGPRTFTENDQLRLEFAQQGNLFGFPSPSDPFRYTVVARQ